MKWKLKKENEKNGRKFERKLNFASLLSPSHYLDRKMAKGAPPAQRFQTWKSQRDSPPKFQMVTKKVVSKKGVLTGSIPLSSRRARLRGFLSLHHIYTVGTAIYGSCVAAYNVIGEGRNFIHFLLLFGTLYLFHPDLLDTNFSAGFSGKTQNLKSMKENSKIWSRSNARTKTFVVNKL